MILSSKKIAIIITNPDFSFTNKNSAVVNFLNLLGEAMKGAGYTVEFFPKNKTIQFDSQKGFSLKRKVKNVLKRIVPNLIFRKKFQQYFNRVDILSSELVEELKDFDLIIEFCVFGAKTSALSKEKWKSKYILIFDAPLELQFKEMYGKTGEFESIIKYSEELSLKKADAIICYSTSVKDYLQKRMPTLINIEVIPCIAWKKQIKRNFDIDKVTIGFIGSFLNWHKVELLVKAFEAIAAKYPKIELLLVGFGQEWNKIKLLVDQSSFNSRIKMTGFMDEAKLEIIKSEMTIGVMPGSNWYGSPLKLFEYAESGIPIIAPETPTVMQYFKHNENALIIDANNELKSLIENLELLINNPEMRMKLGQTALKMMQNDLSKENVMSKFVQLIQNTI